MRRWRLIATAAAAAGRSLPLPLARRGEPVEALVQSLAGRRARPLDVPLALPHRAQAELVADLGGAPDTYPRRTLIGTVAEWRHGGVDALGDRPKVLGHSLFLGAIQGLVEFQQAQCIGQGEGAIAAKRIEAFACGMCGLQRPRSEFWPADLNNRFLYTLGCKTCKPTPLSERRRKKSFASGGQAASSGAGAD